MLYNTPNNLGPYGLKEARDLNSNVTFFASQRGGQNQRSTEFESLSDDEVKSEYNKSKGERRVKLQRELKARGLHGSGKVRGGGIFRGPLLIIPVPEILMHWLMCQTDRSNPSCSIA